MGYTRQPEAPFRFEGLIVRIIVALMISGVIIYGFYVYLNWTVLQFMYVFKADLNWFEIRFYHNNTFLIAAILALIFINPIPRRSHLFECLSAIGAGYARVSGEQEEVSLGPRKSLWITWQVIKWAVGFGIVASANGMPGFGNLSIVVTMLQSGIGDWAQVSKIILLPLFQVSGEELVTLMPIMEVQYRLIYDVVGVFAFVAILRLVLMAIRDFARLKTNAWIREVLLTFSLIVLLIIFGAPYWSMNIATPFVYIITIIIFFGFILIASFPQLVLFGRTIGMARRKRWVLRTVGLSLLVILIINIGFIAGFSLNWNNNWIQYEWKPMTEKEIQVTRWSAGLENIVSVPLSSLPVGNTSRIVTLVRQWDHDASYTKMRNQIGVNWMQLSDSSIIYINGHEYWVAPTTINYLTNDWISQHLIYTHAAKIILIDSHTGDYVTVQQAFGVETDPLIYYGEMFSNDVYVHIKGFDEIGNVSYAGDPDYVLAGWQRMLWFLARGQAGFAFAPPQDDIIMLHSRDVHERVEEILIGGLVTDNSTYLVTDGKRIYYAVQVYVDYPIHSDFSANNYLRFFGVVLVDMEDGHIFPYMVAKPDNFLLGFYRQYYSSWKAPPDWLLPQMRYPEDLLGTHNTLGQLDVDFQFHVSDPFVWRSGSDFYERPEATEVLYILETFGNRVDFVGLQLVEYQASPGRNLAGLYIAYGGDQLGKIDLYRIQNATTQLIGPSAALQALETDDYVRQQLTLLPNYRFGNILLYLIGNRLYYFIPVYINTQVQNAVITKMAFISVIDATTGTRVAVGADSAQAYQTISGGGPVTLGLAERENKLKSIFTNNGYSLINPNTISPDVQIQVNNFTYLNEQQWSTVNSSVNGFVTDYCQKYQVSEVYYWRDADNSLNFGILVSTNGIVKLYYITVQNK